MNKLLWRILIYFISFFVAGSLALLATSCGDDNACEERCDGELEYELCEECADEPPFEPECADLWCD